MAANKPEAGDGVFNFEYIEKFIRLYYGDMLQTTLEESDNDLAPLMKELQGRFSHSFVFNTVSNITELRQHYVYRHMIKAYEKRRISAGLKEVFEMSIPIPAPELRQTPDGARRLVERLAADGSLDLEAFRRPDDTGPEWYKQYCITFIPIIGAEVWGLVGNIKDIKKALPEDLGRIRATMALQIKNRLDADKEAGAASADVLMNFAELLEARAADRKKKRIDPGKYKPWPAGFYERFYINPETKVLYDLRPYAAEIRDLDTPDGWTFAAHYAELLREIVTEWTAAQPKKGSLFQGADFIPLKSTPESMAIASVTSGYSAIFVQPSLPGLDDETEHTADIILTRDGTKTPPKTLTLKVKDKPAGRGLRPSTQKVKTLLEAIFTNTRKPSFCFSVRDYMMLCEANPPYDGVKYRKFAAKLRQDLHVLQGMAFVANYPGLPAGEISILDSWLPSPGGGMEITMGQRYCKDLLSKGGLSQVCRSFFRTDERNPHAIPFLLKLCDNRTMAKNIRKGKQRACTISIKALFDYDRANFPALDKVKKSRRYRELYIEPIIKTLAQLNDAGQIVSKYVNAKHEEYTAADLSRVTFAEIMDRRKWLLEYEVTGFMEDPRLLIMEPKKKKRKAKGRGQHGKAAEKNPEGKKETKAGAAGH